MTSNSISAQFVTLLIEEYKGLPSLWEVDSEEYKNKNIKRKDYDILWQKLLAIDPLLSLNDLKKKIANIRSCYRREVKKITDSIRSGAKGQDVYAPTLWYFNQLDFLRDQESRPHNASSRSELDYDEDQSPPVAVAPPNQQLVSGKRRRSHPYKTEFVNVKTFPNENELVKQRPSPRVEIQQNQTEEPESNTYIIQNAIVKDEANTFSETWAVLFRKLSHEQQLFGKRCIDEILYQGQLGNLNAYTYRNIETSRMCTSDSESSTASIGHCANSEINNSSKCNNNYDSVSKDVSVLFHELCRNPSDTC